MRTNPAGVTRVANREMDNMSDLHSVFRRLQTSVNKKLIAATVATGDPFAKTLDEAGSGRGLISICAAGGQAVTAILEK